MLKKHSYVYIYAYFGTFILAGLDRLEIFLQLDIMDLERTGWKWPPQIAIWDWGPHGWNWIHTVAIRYPLNPTTEDARVAFRRIWNFASRLPCAECRDHATSYILQRPPSLASTHSLQEWVWRFHNATNLRLGKPFTTAAAYRSAYRLN